MLTRRTALLALAAVVPAASRAAADLEIFDLFQEGSGVTERARELEGERIRLTGFMAPPLRAESRFFVLTVSPMPVCPFCDDEADWPSTIMPVFTESVVRPVPFYTPIEARGVLAIGEHREQETGFFSPLRIERGRWSEL